MGCGSTIPTGSATRPGTSSSSAPRRRTPGSWRRRSSNRGSAPRRGLAHRRHGRVRVRQPRARACSSTRAAPGCSTTSGRAVTGDATDYERVVDAAKREVVTDLFAAELDVLHEQLARARRRRRAVSASPTTLRAALTEVLVDLPGLPHLRPRGPRRPRPTTTAATSPKRSRGPALDGPTSTSRSTCSPSCSLLEQGGAGVGRLRHALPAADRPGHGQGRRGHDLLPLPALRGGQRGRRRPERTSAPASRRSTTPTVRRQRDLARHDADHLDPRHQAQRGRPGPTRDAVAAAPTSGCGPSSEWTDLAARHRGRPSARPPSTSCCSCRRSSAPGRSTPIARSAYLRKAAREGKQHTAWIDGDERYEADLEAVRPRPARRPDAVALIERARGRRRPRWPLDLAAQTLLKLTSPGVPDVYQGTELWDLSLVDPDNRRPVDLDAPPPPAR